VPTDCIGLCSSSKLSSFARGNDTTMMVASNATPSTHSPIDGRNIAPPVCVNIDVFSDLSIPVGHYPNTALFNPPKQFFLTSPCQGSDLSSLGRLILKKDGLSDVAWFCSKGGKFSRGAAQ